MFAPRACSPVIFRLTVSLLLLCGALAARGAEPFPPVAELAEESGLPDPLRMLNGEPVATAQDWAEKRRPELKALFEHYMYGAAPPTPEKIVAETVRVDARLFEGKATKKEIRIQFGPPGTPPLNLLLVVPNRRERPAPVFVGANFCGNHTTLADPSIDLPQTWMPKHCDGCVDNRATDEGRGSDADVWNLEQNVDRGYAVATFYCGDIDPDRPDFSDGVHPHYLRQGQKELGPHDWGTIAAWAWGVSRAVDYLVTDGDLDPERIAVVGHSRLGKTALLAAAFDERIALAIPLQAGCGGTAPSRGTVGESVERINTAFPHWFNDTFPEFNQQVQRLPFDQHSLVALVAPRPVLLANAEEDSWANPAGQFQMLQAADPVYRLYGVEGLEATEMPALNTLVNSRLGYFIRPGEHSMTLADWEVFWAFADKQMGAK